MDHKKKVSTTVYITLEQDRLLKLLSEKTHIPVAEYIRQGIDRILDGYRDELPGQMVLFDEPEPLKKLESKQSSSSRSTEENL